MGTTNGPSIEDDFEQPLRPAIRRHRGILAGAPLGVVAVMVLVSVAFGASVVKVAIEAAAAPTPAVVAGAEPTATVEPTAAETIERPSSTPRPTYATQSTHRPESSALPATPDPAAAVADMGALAVADNLDLTVSFSWAAYAAGPFDGYAVFAELTSSGHLPSFPGSQAWATTPTGQRSISIPAIPAGDYQVRVQAICGPDTARVVCGQTGVTHVHLSANRGTTPPPTPVRTTPPATHLPTVAPTPAPTQHAGGLVDLGGLTVADNLDLTVSFKWNPYTGSNLVAYVVVFEPSTTGRTPTYPTSAAWATAGPTKNGVAVSGIAAGTYDVRVQALCGPSSALSVCGQTAVARIHLSAARGASPSPAPTASPTAQ